MPSNLWYGRVIALQFKVNVITCPCIHYFCEWQNVPFNIRHVWSKVIEAVKSGAKMIISHWNCAGNSVVMLTRCPPSFRTIGKPQPPIPHLGYFAISTCPGRWFILRKYVLTLYPLNFQREHKTYVYMSCHSSTLMRHRWLKSFLK